MKNSIYGLLALVLAFVIIQGCQKLNDPGAHRGQLIVNKNHVKINEPDSMFFIGLASDIVKWSVSPVGNDTLLSKGDYASVLFTKAGTYTVSVTDNGGAPVNAVITVSDSVYQAPATTTISFAGDEITLFPYYYKSAVSDSSYLCFTAVNKTFYCATDKMNLTNTIDANNNFNIKFLNITQAGTCNSVNSQLSRGIYFDQHPLQPLGNGTYQLAVSLNDTTYTGSLAVTSSAINFTWPYTSKVTLSTKQISK